MAVSAEISTSVLRVECARTDAASTWTEASSVCVTLDIKFLETEKPVKISTSARAILVRAVGASTPTEVTSVGAIQGSRLDQTARRARKV